MIIKLLLTGNFVLIWLYAFTQRRRAHFIASVMSVLAAGAIYLVWRPDDATALAGLVGVGRGTDLLLYCWVVLSLGIALSLHIKLEHQQELITEMARQFALTNAMRAEPLAARPAVRLPLAEAELDEVDSAGSHGHV
jgi:hypothetical protein